MDTKPQANTSFDICVDSRNNNGSLIPEFHKCPLCGTVNYVKYSEHIELISDSNEKVVHGKIGCGLCSLYIEEKTQPDPKDYTLKFLRKTLVSEWNRLTLYQETDMPRYISIFQY